MYCPKCGKPINDNQNFCGECGATLKNSGFQKNFNAPVSQQKPELKKQCANCGVFNPADVRICPNCGRDMNINYSYSYNNGNNDNGSNNSWLWGCCCLLIVIIVIIALL